MTQFKHGDSVTCRIDGTEIKDAKISINKGGEPYICQNERCGWDADYKLGYKYSWTMHSPYVTDLKLSRQIITWDNIQVGDTVCTNDIRAEKRKVLDCRELVLTLSAIGNFHKAGLIETREELANTHTIIQPEITPEVEEMTMEDVCKALGKVIKIKK